MGDLDHMNHRTFLGEPPYAHRGGFVGNTDFRKQIMVHVFEKVSVSDGKRKSVSFGLTVRRPPSRR